MIKFRSYVLPFAILAGLLVHRWLTLLKDFTPYIIFTILLLNNVAVDMKKLRLSKLDWWVASFQIVVSLGCYFIFKAFGASEIVAQGVMCGIICPVAASSVVVACILGANRETMTTYTIFGNLMVTLVAPIYFSFIGIGQDIPFIESFWMIFRHIFPIIALPFFTALLLGRFAPKASEWLCRYKGISFYLWATALTLTLGQTIDFMFIHGREHLGSIILMGAASIVFCALQFALGKKIGEKFGDRIAGGQMLGQKNSAMGIWMANTYLLPLASVYAALYSIWQNLFNSWQMWRHDHGKNV